MIGGRSTFRVAAGEAGANAASSPARSLLIAVVAAMLAASVVALSVAEVAAIQGRFRDQVEQGRFVLVVRTPVRDGLDARRCDALRDLPGVRSAGAVLEETTAYPLASPLRPYDVLVVTPGLVPVLFPTAPTATKAGIIVGADAASELGLVPGSFLQTAPASARSHKALTAADPETAVDRHRVASVLPTAVRATPAGRTIFEPVAASGSTSACFVDPAPPARSAVAVAMAGWFGPDQPAAVSPYLDEQVAGRQPEAELAGRATRWVWLAAALVLTALLSVLWYGRREEFALYRLLGLRRGSIAVLLAAETVVTVAGPSLVGASIALVLCASKLATDGQTGDDGAVLLPLVAADAASFALALGLLPLVGWCVVGWRSTFDVLKGS